MSTNHDPYQALHFSGFRLLLIGLFIAGLGERMIDVALGWELYQRTGSALVLGGVGLSLVIPILLLSLPAGHLIDRFNRKSIVIISQFIMALASLGLTALSFTSGPLVLIYGCLDLYGCATAFNSPATATLIPQVVQVLYSSKVILAPSRSICLRSCWVVPPRSYPSLPRKSCNKGGEDQRLLLAFFLRTRGIY